MKTKIQIFKCKIKLVDQNFDVGAGAILSWNGIGKYTLNIYDQSPFWLILRDNRLVIYEDPVGPPSFISDELSIMTHDRLQAAFWLLTNQLSKRRRNR